MPANWRGDEAMAQTIAQRAAELQSEIERLRDPRSNASDDARLISLTLEAALLRIEDTLMDVEQAIPSR
jgi:hypothetical protein